LGFKSFDGVPCASCSLLREYVVPTVDQLPSNICQMLEERKKKYDEEEL
jgi:hypothetical protein